MIIVEWILYFLNFLNFLLKMWILIFFQLIDDYDYEYNFIYLDIRLDIDMLIDIF